jgi:biotin transporter BioY
MKRIMYLIGLLASMATSLGLIFRILNWPGGMELIIGGTFGFTFLFLPMLALNHYKSEVHRELSERVKLVLGYASAILFATSVLFKIMHLQGADILLLLSGLVFAFGFLPFLFFRMYKQSVG